MSEILEIFNAGLEAVDPSACLMRSVRRQGSRLELGMHSYDLDGFRRVVVAGAGKAAAGMGAALEELLGNRISRGLLVLPRGARAPFQRLSQAQASHPLPDRSGERAARRILALLAEADEKTLAICLLSGGASAMLAAPAPGATLAEKREVTSLLLASGATIAELNAVRKHLSRVKGGRLAAAAFPAAVLTLALSDVIGDRPEVIGSGPTFPDPSTFADALSVLEKYGLRGRVPARAWAFLERGAAGREVETVKEDDPRLARSAYQVIGNNRMALEAAREKAVQLGMKADIRAAELQGEARDAARFLAGEALRTREGMRPGERRCLLAGGETTVTVKGNGRGGRNQELALAFALEIAGHEGIRMLSAGSDGMDGPTDAAGAVVDGTTIATAAACGLDAAAYLGRNDSYTFFMELDYRSGGRSQLKTGATGTNVMDLQVILLERRPSPGTYVPAGISS